MRDRGAEVDDHAGAADLLEAGDRVDEPVRADLARVVVADRHAGPQARADDEQLVAEVALGRPRPTPGAAAARSRRRSRRRGRRTRARAARAGCAARRRARPRWTCARWRSASARSARSRRRSRGGSGCCRRRRPAACASREVRLAAALARRHALRPAGLAPLRRGGARAAAQGGRLPPGGHDPGRLEAPAVGALRRDDRARASSSTTARRCSARARSCGRSSTARPTRRCCPLDARERHGVEEAERWGDEVLQPLARRLAWAALRARHGRDDGLRRQRGPAGPRPARQAHGAARRARVGVLQRGERPRGPLGPDQPRLPPRPRGPVDREGRRRRARRRRTPPTSRSAPASGCCSRSRTSLPRIEGRPCAREAMRRFPRLPGPRPRGRAPAGVARRAGAVRDLRRGSRARETALGRECEAGAGRRGRTPARVIS